jgi:hypothetical protein
MTTCGEMMVHAAIADRDPRTPRDFDPDHAGHKDSSLSDKIPTGFKHAACLAQAGVLHQDIERRIQACG